MTDMFPNHPRTGFYFSEKGGLIDAYEQPTDESIVPTDSRVNVPTESPSWDSSTIEDTPMTSGTGMYDSSIENH